MYGSILRGFIAIFAKKKNEIIKYEMHIMSMMILLVYGWYTPYILCQCVLFIFTVNVYFNIYINIYIFF